MALIIDLRKDFSRNAVNAYVRDRGAIAGAFIKLTFNTMLKKRALYEGEHGPIGRTVAVRSGRHPIGSDGFRGLAAEVGPICATRPDEVRALQSAIASLKTNFGANHCNT
jgi:hypothetical protein